MKFNLVVRSVLALTVAIGVGYAASVLPAVYMAAGSASVGVILLVRDRLYVFCAIAAFYYVLLPWVPPLVDIGGFSLRLDDVLFAPLLVDSVMRVTYARSSPTARSCLIRIILPMGIFLAYVSMTLFVVARWHPSELGMAIASFVRLLGTSLFILIAYTTFTTEDRIRRFVAFLAFLSVASVLMGAYQFLSYDVIVFERRAAGFLEPNHLGIVSGLLVVLGLVQWRRGIFRSRLVPYFCTGFGFAGIFFSKSISSTLATVVTIGLYSVVHMRRDMLSVIRLFLATVVAASIIVVLIFALRTSAAQSLLALEGGSFFHRLILAQAGLEIFEQNPVWGVGWRMSSVPQVIGATDIGSVLRSQYQGVAEHFFPDVVATSVHNMYVQFLAELGLVGTLLFAWLVLYTGFVVRDILKGSAQNSRLLGCAEYFALGLVFFLVWWNTNPLYGGQLESFLCFIFLGALAAIPAISRRLT